MMVEEPAINLRERSTLEHPKLQESTLGKRGRSEICNEEGGRPAKRDDPKKGQVAEEAKVKKRKLKLFHSSRPPAFTWAFGAENVCGDCPPSRLPRGSIGM